MSLFLSSANITMNRLVKLAKESYIVSSFNLVPTVLSPKSNLCAKMIFFMTQYSENGPEQELEDPWPMSSIALY